jgi:hypothetical protein
MESTESEHHGPAVAPDPDSLVWLMAAHAEARRAHADLAVFIRRFVRRGLRTRRTFYRYAALLLADGEIEGMVCRKVLDEIEECFPGDDHIHLHVRKCLELDSDDALASLPFDDDPAIFFSPRTRAAWADAFVHWSRVFLTPVPADLRAMLGICEPDIPARSASDALTACVLREAENVIAHVPADPAPSPPSMPLRRTTVGLSARRQALDTAGPHQPPASPRD